MGGGDSPEDIEALTREAVIAQVVGWMIRADIEALTREAVIAQVQALSEAVGPMERTKAKPRVARELNEVLRPHNFQPTVDDLMWVVMFDATLPNPFPADLRIERIEALIRAVVWLMSNPSRSGNNMGMQFDLPSFDSFDLQSKDV